MGSVSTAIVVAASVVGAVCPTVETEAEIDFRDGIPSSVGDKRGTGPFIDRYADRAGSCL